MKEKKEKKLTMKEKILRFVEGKGSARFTDIQRFIVDECAGPGTYDKGVRPEKYWIYEKRNDEGQIYGNGRREVTRMRNTWRGTYCTAFGDGYLMLGRQYLEKRGKLYYTVRDGVWKPTPPRWRSNRNHTPNRCKEEIITDPIEGMSVAPITDVAETQLHTNDVYIKNIIEKYAPDTYKIPRYSEDSFGNIEHIIPAPHIIIEKDQKTLPEIIEANIRIARLKRELESEKKMRQETQDALIIAQEDVSILDKLVSNLKQSAVEVEHPKYCRWCGHAL